jgi:hypothetical protein
MGHSRGTDHLTRAGLNLIQQALSIYDADLRLAVSNRPFQTMFGLPEHLVTPGAEFEETIEYLVAAGEYGDVGDVAAFVRDRVEAARAFVPHYMERRRANGRTISVEGSPLPGWGLGHRLYRHHRNETPGGVAARTVRGVERPTSVSRRRTRAHQPPARSHHRAAGGGQARTDRDGGPHSSDDRDDAGPYRPCGSQRAYTYTNRRLSTLLPDRDSAIVGLSFEAALGPVATRLRPTLDRALQGEASVLEFTEPTSGRRIRTAFTPDQVSEGEPINGVYLLSTDVTEEAQARAALAQTHKRELAAQLTNGLAHDFANLLTIILGLQGKLEKMSLPDRAQELIGATQTAARRGGLCSTRLRTCPGRST